MTSWVPGAGPNFGYDQPIEHAQRYARAHEFLEVVTKLWDSWADDAILDDRACGRYADAGASADQLRRPLLQGRRRAELPRSPQGRPVFVQAGSSTTAGASRRGTPRRSSPRIWRKRPPSSSTPTSRPRPWRSAARATRS